MKSEKYEVQIHGTCMRLISSKQLGSICCLCLAFCVIVSIQPESIAQDRVPGFGTPLDKKPVRGFGKLSERFAALAARITKQDRQRADRDMKRADLDGNGVLDREEMRKARFSMSLNDLNGDGKVPHMELVLRHVEYRLGWDRNEPKPRTRRPQPPATNNRRSTKTNGPQPSIDPVVQQRRTMAWNLAADMRKNYDRNNDEIIEGEEWKRFGSEFGNIGGADRNRDRKIDQQELYEWLYSRLPPLSNSRLPIQLRGLDFNGDGQLSLSEFATERTREKIAEFRSYDANGDGLITPKESVAITAPGIDTFTNTQPTVIEARGAVVSAIWVDDDFIIDDIDVRVSITKRNDNFLELILAGPKGQRVVLYNDPDKRPWGGGYLFENTFIDDEAPEIKKMLRKAPVP